jgi:hypothetical protein
VWTLWCAVFFSIALLLTQIGDCFGIQSCVAKSRQEATVVMIAGPAVWLAAAAFVIHRWRRRV